MRQRIAIFLVLFLLIIVLIGLNAVSYVQKEKTPDSETEPNRSTYNAGTTGTQAFYTLLSETGRNVVRWQSPVDALLTGSANLPRTFVIVGRVRRELTEIETNQLLEWVAGGGRLIIIDREPPKNRLVSAGAWKFSFSQQNEIDVFGADPADQKLMTSDMTAAKPVQPTAFTNRVIAVQPSKFASSIGFERSVENPSPTATVDANVAPVIHFASGNRNLLVDVPHGAGQIIFLSDPYIVSNAGVNLVDNAQLAVNIAASGNGLVAFDEYHQGYGSNNNRFLQFFAGTPVVAIFLQCVLLAALVLFSQSRRFARPLPSEEPDRLSKLEYVSAMAQLQQRTKAFDLAIESIYKEFRRRTSKLLGVDNTTVNRRDLAVMIAERIKAEPQEVDAVMFKCEDIIHGEPTNRKETLQLAARLREIEDELGLKRSRTARI